MAEKIKRFIDCYIPTETCNLRCHYCYIAQKRKFNNKLVHLSHSVKTIRKALSKKRLGGTCVLNLCAGGETLLSDEVLEVTKELLKEGHFVMIVTDGTLTKQFEKISKWDKKLLDKLFFKFSFHYLELIRLGWLDKYFSNIELMDKAGASFTVEITPSDELIPYIDEIKEICLQNLGCLCHLTIGRDDRTNQIEVLTNHTFDEYKEIWGSFDSELFKFKSEIFYKKRNEFCYAGDWSVYLNLDNGRLTQCYCGKYLGNIYEDIDKPIRFEAIGCKCTQPHCYNGHAFLTLGDIPELNTPTYAEVRNRINNKGTEWLKPTLKEFYSHKLIESNKEYSKIKKYLINHEININRIKNTIKKRISK